MAKQLQKIINYDLNHDELSDVHTYVDFSIVNNRQDGRPQDIIFNDLRNSKILEDAGSYYLSVVRFHIDTFSSLPAWIPLIQVGQSNPNLTVYSFTLSYGDTNFQAFMEFIPTNKYASTPKPPTVVQDMGNSYYFVHSYQHVFSMINDCLNSAYEGLRSAVGDGFPSTTAPFLLFDPSSKTSIFNADVTAFDVKNNETPIYIYMNNQMYNLLSGFEFQNYGFDAPNGMNYQLQIYNYFNTNVLEQSTTNLIQSYEMYSSTNIWSPVQCVLFESANMAVKETYTQDNSNFNTESNMYLNVSQNATSNTITDFTVSVDTDNNYFPSIDYTPSGVYRLVDLYGHQDVKNIQLIVRWRDIYNNIYPLQLQSGGSCSLKFMFRKKSVGV